MPSVPNFGLFWGRIWGRNWPFFEPYHVKIFLFIDNFELIKNLKSEVQTCMRALKKSHLPLFNT